MSIDIPPELNWLIEMTAGQSWPQGDEDKLSEMGDAWNSAGVELRGVVDEVGSASSAVLSGFNGPAADQFGSFMNSLYTSVPQMAEGAEQIGGMSKQTALQLEYSKYMILAQLIWMAEQIAEWTSTFFGAAAVPVIEAAGQIAVQSILRTLLEQIARSVGESVAAMVGMDVAVQTIQFLKGDRTHWDSSSTLGSLEMGALTGGLGALVGGGAHMIAPNLVDNLLGHIVMGGVNGVVGAAVSNVALGGGGDIGLAAGAGAVGGALGHRGPIEDHGDTDNLNISKIKVENPGDFDTPPPAYHLVADDRPPAFSPTPDTGPDGGPAIIGTGGGTGGGTGSGTGPHGTDSGVNSGVNGHSPTTGSGPNLVSNPPAASVPSSDGSRTGTTGGVTTGGGDNLTDTGPQGSAVRVQTQPTDTPPATSDPVGGLPGFETNVPQPQAHIASPSTDVQAGPSGTHASEISRCRRLRPHPSRTRRSPPTSRPSGTPTPVPQRPPPMCTAPPPRSRCRSRRRPRPAGRW